MAQDALTIVVNVQVNLTFWQALKLRLAGARVLEDYLQIVVAQATRRLQEEEDDAPERW